ncbi:MAG: response regulator transcription factor [Spirochaetales bacterium]|nr:response regulator transcription factor [Spirochaetales bacterium]
MIKIILMDDHQLMRDGMKAVLQTEEDIKVTGEAGTPEELLVVIQQAEADIVMIDMMVAGKLVGPTLIESLRKIHPDLKILVVSMLEEKEYSDRAFALGANGYLPKKEAAPCLLQAVRALIKNEYYISPGLTEKMIRSLGEQNQEGPADISLLSKREQEVFCCLGDGLVTKEIAARLTVSYSTVGTHIENIKKKMKIHNIHELIRKAFEYASK